MKYKVWIEIEAVDEDNDIYESVSDFPVCYGDFDTLEDADRCIVELTGKSTIK